MKYIRVIDDLGEEYLTTYKEHCEMVAELQDSGFDFEGCIIKQADTIKELCDEYVIDKSVCSKKDWEMKTEELKKYILETRIVYGAIWTDKGLIYTARMKGVLPNGEIDWELL